MKIKGNFNLKHFVLQSEKKIYFKFMQKFRLLVHISSFESTATLSF